MTDLNPVSIENAIKACSDRISKGVMVCDERYRAFLEADHAYDVAFARSYLEHSLSPAHERKYAAELDTQELRAARDTADAAYRYADRQARALENELRALQSVGASVRSMFSVAGTGER